MLLSACLPEPADLCSTLRRRSAEVPLGVVRTRPPREWQAAATGFCSHLVQLGVARSLCARQLGPELASASVMVAIPAKDEAVRIGPTMAAVKRSADHVPSGLGVVVFANNCVDGTDAAVVRKASELNLPILLLQGELHEIHRHAGWARRIAMDLADRLCGPDGVILTTDADTSVSPAWAGALAAQLAGSADLVFGDFEVDSPSAAVAALEAGPFWRTERLYASLHDELRHLCDQIVGRQPLGGPRPHYTEAGASIGIRADLYRRIGGLPPMAKSEDRALARAAELAGARIRYIAGATVATSGRLIGRAKGGFAETVCRRLLESDPPVDERLRPTAGLATMWANALRAVRPWQWTAGSEELTGLSPAVRHALMENEWHRALVETPLRVSALRAELCSLVRLLEEQVYPAFADWKHEAAGP